MAWGLMMTTFRQGYPVQTAFGCKNEVKPLDTPAVDNFVGILEDTGIPIRQRILVPRRVIPPTRKTPLPRAASVHSCSNALVQIASDRKSTPSRRQWFTS